MRVVSLYVTLRSKLTSGLYKLANLLIDRFESVDGSTSHTFGLFNDMGLGIFVPDDVFTFADDVGVVG